MRDALALLIVALVTALMGGATWLLSRNDSAPMNAWRRFRHRSSVRPPEKDSTAWIAPGLPLVGVTVGLFLLWAGARELIANGWLLAGAVLGALLGVSATLAHANGRPRPDRECDTP